VTILEDLRGVAKLLTMAVSAAAARMVASMLIPLFPYATRQRHRELLASWVDVTKRILHEEVGLAYLWHSLSLTDRAQRWPRFALVGATYDVEIQGMF
jgi:hypothetical protein